MIISDAGRFVIATPTKCGTTSVEHIAKRQKVPGLFDLVLSDAERGAVDGDKRRRQHRMAKPYGVDGYRPYLLTRNPYSRWVSVWEYLRAPQNYSQWGAGWVQGEEWAAPRRSPLRSGGPLTFVQFLEWLAEMREVHPTKDWQRGKLKTSRAYRSPWVWLDAQSVSFAALEHNFHDHVRLIRLEHLEGDLGAVLRKRKVKGVDLHVTVSNRTRHPFYDHWSDAWSKTAQRLGKRLGLEEECDVLGYLPL